jgi:hypothetical protein
MAEHSPAPWHTGTDEDGHIVYDANAGFVADVGQDDDAELEAANLHLVVAAPKLLAACKALVRRNQKHVDLDCAIAAGKAVIAEATGQKGV